MGNNSSTFQTILLVVFGAALVIGALIFSGVIPGFRKNSNSVSSTVTIWGIIPEANISKFFDDFNKSGGSFKVIYKGFDSAEFNNQLINALADGQGPDLIIASHESILKNSSKLVSIPVSQLPLRTFQNTFVDAGLLFFDGTNFFALPIAIDPLTNYYNKDLYYNAGILNAPVSWEQFVANQPKLSLVDNRNNVLRSATALGTFSNINNAKEILSLLLLQAGDRIVYLDNGKINKEFGLSESQSIQPATAASDFFLEFSDPTKSTYTWNRSLPEARDNFIGGKLANYFGFASELKYITNKNPHLNFDVAIVPQQGSQNRMTFGRIYGIAALKGSKQAGVAIQAAINLSGSATNKKFIEALALPSARRDILSQGNADPKLQVFYDSAVISRAWFDMAPEETKRIFKEMIENISSGRLSTTNAVSKAASELEKAF